MIDEKNTKKSRGRSLIKLLSLLGVYANAEKVLLAQAPSKKRSQREDVIAAIAAKGGAAAPAAAAAPPITMHRHVVLGFRASSLCGATLHNIFSHRVGVRHQQPLRRFRVV